MKYTWHWIGFGWLVLAGVLIHYVYTWTGSATLGLVPVNESIWEHLKLGYTALLVWTPIELIRGKRHQNYFLSKALGVMILELTILVIFYGYTAFTGHPILWIDIASYVMGCALCQYLDLRLSASARMPVWNAVGIVGFIGLGTLFIYFTFDPPHLPIFMDGPTGGYGILVR